MTFDSGNQGRREEPVARTHALSRFQFVVDKNRRYVSHPEAEESGRKDGGTCRVRFPRSEKSTSSYLHITPHISTIFVHEAPIFEKKGSADGHGPGWRLAGAGPGWRRRTRTRLVLARRKLGRDRLGYTQAVDGGAHDAARVTCAFAARIDASGRLLVRSGRIACQSRLKVLPAYHADGA